MNRGKYYYNKEVRGVANTKGRAINSKQMFIVGRCYPSTLTNRHKRENKMAEPFTDILVPCVNLNESHGTSYSTNKKCSLMTEISAASPRVDCLFVWCLEVESTIPVMSRFIELFSQDFLSSSQCHIIVFSM